VIPALMFSSPKGPVSVSGSRSTTSSSAAKISPSRNADANAVSSTSDPRAVFTSTAVGLTDRTLETRPGSTSGSQEPP
jgi:hypothetical protein